MSLQEQEREEKAFAVLTSVFVVVLVLTNVIGVKLFLIFPNLLPNGFFGEPITLTTGILTYPITFLLTDVVCEVYGSKRAKLMVLAGFMISLLSLVLIQAASLVPGSPVWPAGNPHFDSVDEMQLAYESVFSLPGILIFGSMTAYLIAQLVDVRLFHLFKRRTEGRHLWLRNNGSTMVSQLIDTIIVNSIFLGYGLGLDWTVIGKIIFASYLFKILFAAIDTPFVYLGVALLRRYLSKSKIIS
tara:strand:- start:2917 stop:3645 length:729 start_codon:yes stop_codon:yes gene_type:complete